MTERVTCPRCGAWMTGPLAPQGLCGTCLLEEARRSERAAGTAAGAAPAAAPTAEELAPHFPGFEIRDRIGLGGMGAVYRALQRGLDRNIALKVLRREVAEEPGFAERFGREARTLAKLQHPNLVAVHDVGQAGPWYYFVMELVDGVDLRQMMRARETSPREALSIVSQVCDALQYAHDQGVVHRDIKPENILLDRQGRVKILDFGLAKLVEPGTGHANLTHTHQVMGTPHYMAPEQWERPRTVDHRADIFSLGVVFYELLTGELPVGRFAAPSQRVAIDVRLDDVVLRTLEREPERRYQQVSEVRTDVERILGDSPVEPPHGVPAAALPLTRALDEPGPAPLEKRSNALLIAFLIVAVLNALIGLLFFLLLRHPYLG